jgi:hypothetical protein
LALDDTVLADSIFINIAPRFQSLASTTLGVKKPSYRYPVVTLPLKANVQFMTVVATKMPISAAAEPPRRLSAIRNDRLRQK